MDLVEFLRARLLDEEQAALAANVQQDDPDWWVSEVKASFGEHFTVRSRRDNRPIARVQRLDGDDDEPAAILDGAAVAEHIARHDPARVLREVQAKRAIVNRWQELRDEVQHWLSVGDDDAAPTGSLFSYEQVVRLLAGAYADHPEYDEAWKP